MAKLNDIFGGGFNANDEQYKDEFEGGAIPPTKGVIGKVNAAVVKQKEGKARVELEVDLLSPETIKGRKAFVGFNLQHPNQKAAQIGAAQFASFCKAAGKPLIQDEQELNGVMVVFDIELQKNNKDFNEFRNFKPYGGQAPQAQATATPPTVTAPAGEEADLPW